MTSSRLLLTLMLTATPLAALAQSEVVVSQKNKAFSQKSVRIKAGDKVAFRNDDPFVHNIFSLSDPTPFDLGTYAQGQTRTQTFSKAGKFEVECAIHPEMRMEVVVQ